MTSCYVLGDIASHGIKKLSLAALWRKTKNYLVRVCHSLWVCVDRDDAMSAGIGGARQRHGLPEHS